MDLKFIWEQAQLAKERENELNSAVAVCHDYEIEVQRLKEVEKDFKELLGCIILFSDETGGYISRDKSEIVRLIKRKYDEQI